MPGKICSVVLLAGYSKRMGKPKQHVRINDQTFLQTIIARLAKNRQFLHSSIFIGQEQDMESRRQTAESQGQWLTNPNPEIGPISSIRLALNIMPEDSAMLLWPVDHPMISSHTVTDLITLWQHNPDSIVVPSDGERRGHPTIFPACCRKDFLDKNLEKGAKSVLHQNSDRIVHMVTQDIWTMKNLNTPELLEEARLFLQPNY